MIRQSEIGIAPLPRCICHLFEGVGAIRLIGVSVQHTADIFVYHQFGQLAFKGEFNLQASFAQFRRDEGQTKRRINLFFCRTCEDSFPVAQSVGIECPALFRGERPQRGNVLFRTGGQEQRDAVAGVAGDMNRQPSGLDDCRVF